MARPFGAFPCSWGWTQSPSPWIASCPQQTGSALCKLTQGEHDGNCEKTGRQEGSPREESCNRCQASRSKEGCSRQKGSRSRQEGRSSKEGRSRQEGCSTRQESCSCQEGRSSEEGRSCQEGCSTCKEGACRSEEGCSCQGSRQEGSTSQEGRQGACPCPCCGSRSPDHAEPPGSLAFPYGQQALRRTPCAFPNPAPAPGFLFLRQMVWRSPCAPRCPGICTRLLRASGRTDLLHRQQKARDATRGCQRYWGTKSSV